MYHCSIADTVTITVILVLFIQLNQQDSFVFYMMFDWCTNEWILTAAVMMRVGNQCYWRICLVSSLSCRVLVQSLSLAIQWCPSKNFFVSSFLWLHFWCHRFNIRRFFLNLVNSSWLWCACGFNQSEMGNCLKWIIVITISINLP